MTGDLLAALAPFVPAIAAGLGGLLMLVQTRRGARDSPYDSMRQRLKDTEARMDLQDKQIEELQAQRVDDVSSLKDATRRIELLEADRSEDRDLIRDLIALLKEHSIPIPFPLPGWLRKPRHTT